MMSPGFTESIVSKRLKAAAREAGITKRIYPHLLRHSFATHLLEQGTDIKIVKELMGHNNIKTTERYVHIADTFKSNIKSPLDDLLLLCPISSFTILMSVPCSSKWVANERRSRCG